MNTKLETLLKELEKKGNEVIDLHVKYGIYYNSEKLDVIAVHNLGFELEKLLEKRLADTQNDLNTIKEYKIARSEVFKERRRR